MGKAEKVPKGSADPGFARLACSGFHIGAHAKRPRPMLRRMRSPNAPACVASSSARGMTATTSRMAATSATVTSSGAVLRE